MNKLNYLFLLLFLINPYYLSAQNTKLATNFTTVNEVVSYLSVDAFEKHITILASDEMNGRNMLQGGDKLAADYIKTFYNQNNLPTYNEERVLEFSVFVPQYTTFNVSNKNAILNKDNFEMFPFNNHDLNGDIEILYIDELNYKNLYRRYTRDKGIIFHHYDHYDALNGIKLSDLDAKILIRIKDNEFNLKRDDFKSLVQRVPIRACLKP